MKHFYGTLHNIGKLIPKTDFYSSQMPDDLDVEHHQSLFKNIFPIFHNEAGKIIAKFWKLDKTVEVSISQQPQKRYMDCPADSLRLASLVNLAQYISRTRLQ